MKDNIRIQFGIRSQQSKPNKSCSKGGSNEKEIDVSMLSREQRIKYENAKSVLDFSASLIDFTSPDARDSPFYAAYVEAVSKLDHVKKEIQEATESADRRGEKETLV